MSDISQAFPLTERAHLLRRETSALVEQARTLRVETAALLSATRVVFGKSQPSTEVHGIASEWMPHYEAKLAEKFALLRNI